MKQNIDPRVAIGLIAVVALIAIGLIWRTFTGASAPAHSAGGGDTGTSANQGSRARVDEMRNGHMGH